MFITFPYFIVISAFWTEGFVGRSICLGFSAFPIGFGVIAW